MKRFGKFMVKMGYRARRKKSSSKSKDEARRCFKCGSKDHLVAQCPYNSDNDDDDKKEKKEKKDKMTIKKKKKGGSYVVTWDSDASSSDDDDSDDDKTTKKKALASIAINEKPLWLRPLRYKLMMMDVMRNMIMKVKVKVTMMMNPLKMN